MKRIRGFSLIELMVVLSLIALLIGLLLPALSTARVSARRMKCSTQLRQIDMYRQAYTNQFNDLLPPRGSSIPWPALFVSQTNATQIMFCPSDDSRAGLIPSQVILKSPNESSYLLNVFNKEDNDGNIIDAYGSPLVIGLSPDLRRVPNPSSAIIFVDKIEYHPTSNSFLMDLAHNDHLYKTDDSRHNGMSTAFMDGHVEVMSKADASSPKNLWTADPKD